MSDLIERLSAALEGRYRIDQHPHILPLFDSGEADGFLFYVMPYIEGESLREGLEREKQLPWTRPSGSRPTWARRSITRTDSPSSTATVMICSRAVTLPAHPDHNLSGSGGSDSQRGAPMVDDALSAA